MVKEHGIEKVSEATGYKVSTLIAITGGYVKQVAADRVIQAEYVFKNLKSE